MIDNWVWSFGSDQQGLKQSPIQNGPQHRNCAGQGGDSHGKPQVRARIDLFSVDHFFFGRAW
jgi:hypothetical protein